VTRRIINSTSVSLDGVIELMEHWHFDYVDDEYGQVMAEQLAPADVLLLGRRTYDSWAVAWPSRTGEIADKFNTMQKYVASTTMSTAEWQNTTIIKDNLVDEVRKIKEQPGGDIITYGFGPIAGELLRHGLLDEIHLAVNPVFAGVGSLDELLFQEGARARLDLLGTRALSSGVVVLSYRPSNEENRTA